MQKLLRKWLKHAVKLAYLIIRSGYGGDFSKEGAALSIANAEEFIKKSEEFLSKNP